VLSTISGPSDVDEEAMLRELESRRASASKSGLIA
jgi:hypothetical protein